MIDMKVTGIKELVKACEGTSRKMPKELAIAVNATTKKVRSEMSKQLRGEFSVKAADLKPILAVKGRATPTKIGSMVQLDATKRMSLKSFRPRQTRAGTAYTISKKSGRKTAPGAFMGPRPGAMAIRLRGHVYARLGASRYPIVQLKGPSPGGVYIKQRMRPKTVSVGSAELSKQIDRRVRFILLKKQGLI